MYSIQFSTLRIVLYCLEYIYLLMNISISLGPVQRTIQCSAVQRTGFVHSNPLYFTSVHSLALPSLGGRNPSSHHCVTFSDLWISTFFSVFWETCNGKEYIQLWSSFEKKITSTFLIVESCKVCLEWKTDFKLEVTAEEVDDSYYSCLVI